MTQESTENAVKRSLADVPNGPIRDRLLSSINLLDNYTRGWVAEVIVAEALHATMVGDGYGDWDLELDGKRIEVKASGDIQAWPQKNRSIITFGIAQTEGYVEQADGSYIADTEKRRRSDVYVFAHHKGTIPDDPTEWEFYVVATAQVDRECGDQKTIGLVPLARRFRVEPVGVDQLRSAVLKLQN